MGAKPRGYLAADIRRRKWGPNRYDPWRHNERVADQKQIRRLRARLVLLSAAADLVQAALHGHSMAAAAAYRRWSTTTQVPEPSIAAQHTPEGEDT